jgi:hypothetical protein
MAVYVDDVRHRFGRMVMCHMWADTLDELMAMADRIGVQRKWLQGHPELSLPRFRKASWVHFDISLGMKAKALAAGAVLTDKYGPVEYSAREAILNGCEAEVAWATRKLETIAKLRAS